MEIEIHSLNSLKQDLLNNNMVDSNLEKIIKGKGGNKMVEKKYAEITSNLNLYVNAIDQHFLIGWAA